MITLNEVKQIVNSLSLQNPSIWDARVIDDISCIVYRNDVFECGDTTINNRHIDIELSFGEYYEICEETPLFQSICNICNLLKLEEEQEIIIYKK